MPSDTTRMLTFKRQRRITFTHIEKSSKKIITTLYVRTINANFPTHVNMNISVFSHKWVNNLSLFENLFNAETYVVNSVKWIKYYLIIFHDFQQFDSSFFAALTIAFFRHSPKSLYTSTQPLSSQLSCLPPQLSFWSSQSFFFSFCNRVSIDQCNKIYIVKLIKIEGTLTRTLSFTIHLHLVHCSLQMVFCKEKRHVIVMV